MKTIKCKPPAKINLGLRVLSRRPDGFHEIETVFHALQMCDVLEVSLTVDHDISVSVLNTDIPNDERNLCYRAAALFSQRYPDFAGCRIVLAKHVPDGAGLGGGSSDAAWTLICLNKLCNAAFQKNDLLEMGALLGSDVPYFFQGGTALGTGRGEIIAPIAVSWVFFILVVCPTVRISTAWAYANLKMTLTSKPNYNIFDILLKKSIKPEDFRKHFTNDFEPLVFARYPFLLDIKKQLYDMKAFFAGMSGTGSAIFGLFFDEDTAMAAKEELEQDHAVYLTQSSDAGHEVSLVNNSGKIIS